MNPQDILVNPNTYASLLQSFVETGRWKKGHGHMIKTRFEQATFAGYKLVKMYAKYESLRDTCQVFDKKYEQNLISWASVIAGYVQQGTVKRL